MNDHDLRQIQNLVHLASNDLFWTKARSRSTMRAAFESVVRRAKMERIIGDLALSSPPRRIDDALRHVARLVQSSSKECDQSLSDHLIKFALQYERIERCAVEEKANWWQRVAIYRRIPLAVDPTFADLRKGLGKPGIDA